MKIIQTYYSFNNLNNPMLDRGSFYTPTFQWMSMALSCVLLKRHFKNVSLYCNREAIDFLKYELKLPYDHFIEIGPIPQEYIDSNLWAIPKLYTYSLQKQPFIHVDIDWYMFEKPDYSVLNGGLIAQNIEYDDLQSNRKIINLMCDNHVIFPDEVLNHINSNNILRVANAGFFGGSDIPFFQYYINEAFNFINSNIHILLDMKNGFINSIYEQLFFYIFAQNRNKSIHCVTSGDYLSTRFDWLPIDLSYLPKQGYMHFIAGIKRNINAFKFVSHYLRHLSPAIFSRIISVSQYYKIDGKDSLNHLSIYSDSDCREFDFSSEILFNRTYRILEASTDLFPLSKLSDVVLNKQDEKATLFYKLDSRAHDVLKNVKRTWQNVLNVRKESINLIWSLDNLKVDRHINISIPSHIEYTVISQEDMDILTYPNKNPINECILIAYFDIEELKHKEIILSGIAYKIFKLIELYDSISIFDCITTLLDNLDLESNEYLQSYATIRKMIISGVKDFIYIIGIKS